MRRLLRPLSWLYGLVVVVRNKLFDLGILTSEKFPVPVISVGNLIAGGSGKSPHVLLLLGLFRNRRVAVLSRGYGRKTKGFRLVQATDSPEVSGDEPLQYLHYFPQTIVAVCESRREGIRQLLAAEDKPDIIVLDDAYQHRYVKAGFSILLTEYNRPFTKDHLLPEGMLREPAAGASRADLVILTKCPEQITPELLRLRKDISRYSDAPVAFSYMRYRDLTPLNGGISVPLAESGNIIVLTGIARPEPMLAYLRAKTNVVRHLKFGDHHEFTVQDTKQILEIYQSELKAGKQVLLVTTRKDAMRLREPAIFERIKSLPVHVLDIEAVLHPAADVEVEATIMKYVQSDS